MKCAECQDTGKRYDNASLTYFKCQCVKGELFEGSQSLGEGMKKIDELYGITARVKMKTIEHGGDYE